MTKAVDIAVGVKINARRGIKVVGVVIAVIVVVGPAVFVDTGVAGQVVVVAVQPRRYATGRRDITVPVKIRIALALGGGFRLGGAGEGLIRVVVAVVVVQFTVDVFLLAPALFVGFVAEIVAVSVRVKVDAHQRIEIVDVGIAVVVVGRCARFCGGDVDEIAGVIAIRPGGHTGGGAIVSVPIFVVVLAAFIGRRLALGRPRERGVGAVIAVLVVQFVVVAFHLAPALFVRRVSKVIVVAVGVKIGAFGGIEVVGVAIAVVIVGRATLFVHPGVAGRVVVVAVQPRRHATGRRNIAVPIEVRIALAIAR